MLEDNLGKFDAKLDVKIFLGYLTSSKAFRVFNKRTMVVKESIHVIFYESNNSLQERKTILENLMQNRMLEFSLVTQLQVKLLEFLTKEPWLYKSPSMSYFMNLTILSKKESFDDDLGLETSIGKLAN